MTNETSSSDDDGSTLVVAPPGGIRVKINPQLRDALDQRTFLAKESERGAIIVGAAILDAQIEELLLAFLAPTETSEYLVSQKGPLGNFGARINAAYTLGLITAEVKKRMTLVMALRNLCAHEWNLDSIESTVTELEERDKHQSQHVKSLDWLKADVPELGWRSAFEEAMGDL